MRNNSNRCGVLIQLNEKQSAEQVSFLAYGCQFRFENLKREKGGSGEEGDKWKQTSIGEKKRERRNNSREPKNKNKKKRKKKMKIPSGVRLYDGRLFRFGILLVIGSPFISPVFDIPRIFFLPGYHLKCSQSGLFISFFFSFLSFFDLETRLIIVSVCSPSSDELGFPSLPAERSFSFRNWTRFCWVWFHE